MADNEDTLETTNKKLLTDHKTGQVFSLELTHFEALMLATMFLKQISQMADPADQQQLGSLSNAIATTFGFGYLSDQEFTDLVNGILSKLRTRTAAATEKYFKEEVK